MEGQVGRHGGHPSTLIGRDIELTAIEAALATERLVTLTGLGGTGKTTLALALVARMGERSLATRVVDLAPVSDAAAVPGAIARVLEARESASVDIRSAIAVALGSSEIILVLDNFEQILSAKPLLTWLLERVPALRILVTSRVRVGLDEEFEIRIEPLALPASDADLNDAPASRLFLSAARIDDPSELSAADRTAVARICRSLDGLPLALNLAAAWTTILSPRAIERRLDARALRLEHGETGRQASVERIVDATLELVSPDDRSAFEALGTFVGAFHEEALRAVLDRDEVLNSLRALAQVALVQVNIDPDGEPSFRLLETVRAVAEARLTTAAGGSIRRRHATYYLALAEAAADRLRSRTFGDAEAAAKLDDPNLMTAFAFGISEADAELSTRIAVALSPGAVRSGRLSESAACLERGLELGPVPDAVRADALNSLASIRRTLGLGAQVELATAAVEAARLASDPRREGRTLVTLGIQLGPEGLDAFEEAIRIGRRVEYHWLVATATMNLGNELQNTDRMDEAAACFLAAGTAYEAAGDRVGSAFALASTGELHMAGGRRDLAIAAFEEAIPMLRDSGPPNLSTFPLTGLAILLAEAGDMADAWVHLTEATAMVRKTESADARNDIALVAAILLARDQPAAAARAIGGTSEATLAPVYRARRRDVSEKLARTLGQTRFAREVRAGARLGWPELATRIMTAARAANPALTLRIRTAFETLTPREGEVLRLLADGTSDQEIARILHISPKTASVHVGNVKGKLGAGSRVEAALMARRLLDDISSRSGGSGVERPAIPDSHGRN